jgi:peroxiredoxin
MRRWIRIALVLAVVYCVLCLGLFAAMSQTPSTFGVIMSRLPVPVVMMGFPVSSLWSLARAGTLQVGDPAPGFDLPTLDGGSRVRLSDFRGAKPVVLVFGSYTCPPFRNQVPQINAIYHKYKDRAAFYIIYIQEAHPSDRWQLESNIQADIVFSSPGNLGERGNVASACIRNLGIEFPALLDELDDSTEAAYTAWPDRMFVIDTDGIVTFKSQPGPWGFQPEHLEDALGKLLPSSCRLSPALPKTKRRHPTRSHDAELAAALGVDATAKGD